MRSQGKPLTQKLERWADIESKLTGAETSVGTTAILCYLPEKKTLVLKFSCEGFPGGAVVKNPPANAGDTGSSPGPGRSHVPRSN